MPLNLISDAWIPVRGKDGARRVIAPWQIAEPEIDFPDWPRADLNIACLELLIGLVFMADPPADNADWRARRNSDPKRLNAALVPFAPAFHLMGGPDGALPRFMQDFVPLDGAPNLPDLLFIDSAGESAAKKNSDLMTWRNRYPVLDPALAAMALYTFQDFAPAGGAGNRTSMRGGGPMVTLVDPGQGLWSLIWANVPNGTKAEIGDLPWARPCRTSEGKNDSGATWPDHGVPVEAFFGQPRRLRLVGDETGITGVVQKPWGTQYLGWSHYLSPSYRIKVSTEWLFKHPKPGAFGYRNWLGVLVSDTSDKTLTKMADNLIDWPARSARDPATVIVAGWAMDKMSPRDFIFSRQPLLSPEAQDLAHGMALAANHMAGALMVALRPVLGAGEAREAQREAFYMRTQAPFEALLTQSTPDSFETTAHTWLDLLGATMLDMFEDAALPGLPDRTPQEQNEIVSAHRILKSNTRGQAKLGRAAYAAVWIDPPEKPKKTTKDMA